MGDLRKDQVLNPLFPTPCLQDLLLLRSLLSQSERVAQMTPDSALYAASAAMRPPSVYKLAIRRRD